MTALLEGIVSSIHISTAKATVVERIFPNSFLDANGYQRKGYCWGDKHQLFYTLLCNSGFEIHVVDNNEVWIERFGKLSLLKNINSGADLMDLERLLS